MALTDDDLLDYALSLNEEGIANEAVRRSRADGLLWIARDDLFVRARLLRPLAPSLLEETGAHLVETLASEEDFPAPSMTPEIDLDESLSFADAIDEPPRRIVIPIHVEGECIGGFLAYTASPLNDEFGLWDACARAFAISFQLRSLQRRIRLATDRLGEAAEIGQIIAATGAPAVTLSRLLDLGMRFSRAQAGAIVRREDANRLTASGLPLAVIESLRRPDGTALVAPLLDRGEEFLAPSASIAEQVTTADTTMILESLAAFPLGHGEEHRGLLLLVNPTAALFEDEAYLATLRLISQLAAATIAAEERQRAALFDVLTGLPNSLAVAERTTAGETAVASNRGAVILLGIDRFALIQENLGHIFGDRMLAEIAERLRTLAGPGDLIARIGGDEFALFVRNVVDREHTAQVALRLQRAIDRPIRLDGNEIFVGASLGIAPAETAGEDLDALLRRARIALRHARAKGGGRSEFFTPAMQERAVKMIELDRDLRRAITDRELRPHFQPIVGLADGRLRAFEALIRWRSAERGPVSPGEFIPLAEETGLIVPIGEQILEDSCAAMARWRAGRDEAPGVSVNVAPRQLLQKDFTRTLERVLAATAIPPADLRLEITESAIMENIDLARKRLEEWRGLGVQIALDDFGTGHSSLGHLLDLPFDILKVDQKFVRSLTREGKEAQILGFIVAMARGLGLLTVAEGIETEDQHAIVRDCGCDYGQGFLYGKAFDEETAARLVSEGGTFPATVKG